jgi:tRNA-dihydrouridine synthase B
MPKFQIDSVPVYGDLVLAPMVGVSDFPYRMLTRELGSAMSYTEFVNAIDVINGHPYLVKERLTFSGLERPVIFQIFDDQPDRLMAAASEIVKLKPDILDINMGCSVRTVTNRGAGAGLLKSPQIIAQIFGNLTRSLSIPITGKIRLGWDEDNRNFLDIAKTIEDHGGSMIAVHARTKKQGFQGMADWDAIALVKHTVRIPVIGNGDVRTITDIERLISHTRCDAVMIGRAAIGNPWIFRRIDRSTLLPGEIIRVILQHLGKMIEFYGFAKGPLLFRRHLAGYLKPYPINKHEKTIIFNISNPLTLSQVIGEIISRYQ